MLRLFCRVEQTLTRYCQAMPAEPDTIGTGAGQHVSNANVAGAPTNMGLEVFIRQTIYFESGELRGQARQAGELLGQKEC